MLTCVSNFAIYLCFSTFTEEDGTTNNNEQKKNFEEKILKFTQFRDF